MTEEAEVQKVTKEDTQAGKYMTFICDDDCYGIEIKYVNEIIGIQNITEVPDTEKFIKGLINLRGKIHPVIDVRERFRKPPVEYNDRTCIIVIDVESVVVGLIVDTIAGVVELSEDDIVPPPALNKDSASHFIYGIGKIKDEVKLLIDPVRMINVEEE